MVTTLRACATGTDLTSDHLQLSDDELSDIFRRLAVSQVRSDPAADRKWPCFFSSRPNAGLTQPPPSRLSNRRARVYRLALSEGVCGELILGKSVIRHTHVVRHIAGDHRDPLADTCDGPPAGAEHAESGLMQRLCGGLPDSRRRPRHNCHFIVLRHEKSSVER